MKKMSKLLIKESMSPIQHIASISKAFVNLGIYYDQMQYIELAELTVNLLSLCILTRGYLVLKNNL
jgi:hypothetical protein